MASLYQSLTCEREDTLVVRDANNDALAYVYFEEEPGGDRRRISSPATTPGTSPPSRAAVFAHLELALTPRRMYKYGERKSGRNRCVRRFWSL